MNRKDGGRGREDEGGSPQLEPGRKLPGTGEGRRQARLGARRNGGREEAGKAGGKEERGKEEAIFRVFWGKKRKKEG